MLSIIEFVIHGALLGLAAYFAFDMIEGVLEQGGFSNEHYADVGDLFMIIMLMHPHHLQSLLI